MAEPAFEIVYGKGATLPADAIAAHGRLLAAGLAQIGFEARTSSLPEATDRRPDGALRRIVLQYNPFSYGRGGFAPRAISAVSRIRRRPDTAGVAIFVHEPWVPWDPKTLAVGAWQRLQLYSLGVTADRIFVPSQRYGQRLTPAFRGRVPVVHIPVGSNVPDRRSERSRVRDTLGVDGDALVVALVGSTHPGNLTRRVTGALRRIGTAVGGSTVINLGAAAPPIETGPAVTVVSPGYLADDEFAAHLAASDLFLSAFEDGLTTRRTSLMAALQHGLPVLSTSTTGTDDVLVDAGDAVRLVPVADEAGFLAAAEELGTDRDLRQGMGAAARRLFEREFAWPVLARRFASEFQRSL